MTGYSKSLNFLNSRFEYDESFNFKIFSRHRQRLFLLSVGFLEWKWFMYYTVSELYTIATKS